MSNPAEATNKAQTLESKTSTFDAIMSPPNTSAPNDNKSPIQSPPAASSDHASIAASMSTVAPDRDPFAACHKVLSIPELCTNILEHLEDCDLIKAVASGAPFSECALGSNQLGKRLFLDYYTREEPYYLFNTHFFWFDIFCGHGRGKPCNCAMYESNRDFAWPGGGFLPEMDIDYTGDTGTVELKMYSYEQVVKALESRELFLQMVLGNQPTDIKIVVSHPDIFDHGIDNWQGPPFALEWKTAEVTVDGRDLRMRHIFAIAKSLYECVMALDSKLFSGELDWDEEKGTIKTSSWKDFFTESQLKSFVSDQPTYRWFCKSGRGHEWVGTTFDDHYKNRDWDIHLEYTRLLRED